MNNIATILVAAGGTAPIAAIIGAVSMLWVNRNNAVKLLSEAQQIAQRTALDSANSALATVEGRCTRCEQKLSVIETCCEDLITAAEAMLEEPTVENRQKARTAIWAARHAI